MNLRHLFAIALFIPSPAVAQTQPSSRPADDSSRFSLTIYSTADPATFDPRMLAQQRQYYGQQYKLPGYGVVREVRPIDLNKGLNTLRFTDVAAGIDPTTVAFESLTAPGSTSVLEQNFEYDLLDANKLLEKYLDQQVKARLKSTGGATASTTIIGTLLSSDGGTLVIQTEQGEVLVLARGDLSSIELASRETGLITKPTLVWLVDSEQAGKHDARVTYQTDG